VNIAFQISGQATIYNERVAVFLGFASLLLVLTIFATCRTFGSLLSQAGLASITRSHAYQTLGRYHLYYWWFFGVTVLAHLMMAVFHTGLPVAGDRDTGIHWTILAAGLASGISGTTLFLSCRVSPRLLSPALPQLTQANKLFGAFFRKHSYYWLALGVLLITHVLAAYLHVGFWPGAGG
jgi:hypothetical protein